MRVLAVTVLVLAFVAGCDKADSKADSKAKDEAEAAKKADEADKAKSDADPGDAEKSANFADPQAEPPPAPEGATTLRDPWLYVQTCAEPHPCPDLLQPAGDKHCRELKLGGHVNWRLPDKEEVQRFARAEGLEAREGYHWTRTPDEENMAMVWIVDPAGAQPTTVKRDRKPFTIRCVYEP